MFTDEFTGQLSRVYNAILFNYEKKRSPETCHNTDETWKHHAKWNKSDVKWPIWGDSIYMKYPR